MAHSLDVLRTVKRVMFHRYSSLLEGNKEPCNSHLSFVIISCGVFNGGTYHI